MKAKYFNTCKFCSILKPSTPTANRVPWDDANMFLKHMQAYYNCQSAYLWELYVLHITKKRNQFELHSLKLWGATIIHTK
jgi:hypothetical protein